MELLSDLFKIKYRNSDFPNVSISTKATERFIVLFHIYTLAGLSFCIGFGEARELIWDCAMVTG